MNQHPERSSASTHASRRGPLSLRVALLTVLLIPLNAWWLVEVEYVRYSDNATTQALFFNAVALLIGLLGLNRLARRVRPALALSTQEMVALYVAVVVASNLAGHDVLQILFTTIAYVVHNDTPASGWGTSILPHLPAHLLNTDRESVDGLFRGNTTLYRWDHVLPWLGPLGWWTLFAMLVVWTMLCLSSLFRRQWEAERLSYPIAEIPLQLITGTSGFWQSKVLWAGIIVGATGQAINMAHNLVPSIPGVPIGVQYYRFETYPWNAAGPLPISSFPFAYGLTFLLPTQLGFSCWFFFLVSRLELVAAATLGYMEWGKAPYIQQQGVGAIFGLFLAVVYAARGELVRTWSAAWSGLFAVFGRKGTVHLALADQEPREALSPALAVFGGIAGGAGLVLFAVNAGMRWQTALLFLGILFVIVVVVARLRAELGLPTFELYQVGADQVLQRVSGTTAWTRNDLGVMSLFFWLCRTHRQFPMQSHVDALRLSRRTGTHLPAIAVVILAASALGIVAAFWALLHSTYQVGFDSAKFRGPAIWAFGREPWQKLEAWYASPSPPDGGAVTAYGFGLLFTLFLAGMRARFVWWPFHPAGYMVSGSFGLFRLWLPIFVSWLIKTLILRYGGLTLYRRTLPFFLGLVIGEFCAGFLRTVVDLAFGLHLPPESGIGGL